MAVRQTVSANGSEHESICDHSAPSVALSLARFYFLLLLRLAAASLQIEINVPREGERANGN